jgi:hypothetical protein
VLPAAASAIVDPVDLEGTYTVYDPDADGLHPQCNGPAAVGTLTISNWYGWTVGDSGNTGVFDASFTDSLGNTSTSTGPGSGNSESGNSMTMFTALAHNWTISTGISSVTLTENGSNCPDYAVNTTPESLSSLPSISGAFTKNGKPVGPGTMINLGAMSQNGFCCSSNTAADGTYHYWVQPGKTYSVEAIQAMNMPPLLWYAQCIGGRVLPKTLPQGCVFQLLPNNPPDNGIGNFSLNPPLVVNSTGDQDNTATDLANGVCNVNLTGPQACTLRAAIEVANQTGGGNISFDIPDDGVNTFDNGVPQIKVSGSALPQMTAPTTIDGTSQPGARQVELSGRVSFDAVNYGLVVGAGGGGSTIKGMVINGFQEMIDLKAGGDTVQGDMLGTNASGTAPEPVPLGPSSAPTVLPIAQVGIRIESSGNQIGGPGSGQGNVVASSYTEYGELNLQPPVTTYGLIGSGDIYDTTGGNVIQGNWIGISPGGGQAPAEGAPLIDPPPAGWASSAGVQGGVVATGADTIGGSAAGAGNLIGGGGIAGPGNVVQGNTFTDGGLDHAAPAASVPSFLASGATIGGATATPGTGVGNTFYAVDATSFELAAGDDAVVQGNVFRGDTWGGITLVGQHVTIGGATGNLGNVIENNGYNESLVEGAVPGGPPGFHNAGIHVEPSGGGLIEHNTLQNNIGGGAVGILGGPITVTDNVMTGNSFGISFDGTFYADGQTPPLGQSPNGDQPYPIIRSAESSAGGTVITGLYAEPAPNLVHSLTVDLYAMKTCGDGGISQQGEVFLGSRSLSVSFGESDFTLTFDRTPSGYDGVTATATAPDGSTSEFSTCFTIGDHPDPFYKVGVAPTSTTVAITTTPPPGGASDAMIAAVKRGKGHGTLLLFCPISAAKYCRGTFAVRTTAKHPQRLAARRFKILPGYVKPVALTISGKLLANLERAHHLAARLTTTAHDGAKPAHHKKRSIKLKLVYK